MPRFFTPPVNDDGWTDWQLPLRRYKAGCCDCGLVHDIEFRVIVVGRQRRDRTYPVLKINPARCRIQFRARRNERSTGQMRRHRKPR